MFLKYFCAFVSLLFCRFLVQWCKSWSLKTSRRSWREPTTQNMGLQPPCLLKTSIRPTMCPVDFVLAQSGKDRLIGSLMCKHSQKREKLNSLSWNMRGILTFLIRVFSYLCSCTFQTPTNPAAGGHHAAMRHHWMSTLCCCSSVFIQATFNISVCSCVCSSAGLIATTCLGLRLRLEATRLQVSAESWASTAWTTTRKLKR